MELQLEKENRMVQLHSSVGHNYSHDSAIDTDMQEYDSEILSIDIVRMIPTFAILTPRNNQKPVC